ncbi:MAG: ATP-binding cassette domain-containing protein [Pseudohongiellaceae bacterium]|nr:ATP-binding cassette domain-containing protein [Pseudohongiellaceae bacterium]
MQEPILELNNVCKKYGSFAAVQDMSFTIPKGSIYGFLGPNGAGKTTTIRMILDILKPDTGSINILGNNCALNVRHRIGYLPEEKGLYKKMKVSDIISYFAMLKGMKKPLAKKRADELLKRYGLKDYGNAKVESLSKGMGQKVQVLSAVAHDPELVILDEPFSGLDPVNQEVLEQLIKDMANNGQTVIFSTHIMQHAERLCDRMLLIAKGQKIFDGSLDDARAIIPRRVTIECAGDISQLRQIEGVIDIIEATPPQGSNIKRWEILIHEQTNPQLLLQNCFEKGLNLSHFDHTQASLHDVFVHLVGSEAKEHSLR